uniref:Uncharacterized protein n=1 Tax=Anguilla anguilla TaxID=7936 RepID=A0A0E9XFM7_ANGAN
MSASHDVCTPFRFVFKHFLL